MKRFYKLLSIILCCFFCTVGQNAFAQPPNDECSGAIDISEAFMGECGDFTFNGPFTLTGSTPGTNDPPEPGEMGVCPGETDDNLFGDDSEEWENSVWYKWTVPDLNGDGSDVVYSVWTTDGSFGDDCGINPNDPLQGDGDTQVAMYKGVDCPDSSFGECDHFAANEDLFQVPPWISGWLTLEFTPGETYYMAVDGWDGAQGEFCLTVVICGVECGDGDCAPVETYCDCLGDCEDNCPASAIYGIDESENGNFRSPEWTGNVLHCSERVVGFNNGNLYLTVSGSDENCSESGLDLPIDLSIGSIVNTDPDGMDTISAGFYTFIELTPEDMAVGSITITATQPDGLGNTCNTSRTIDLSALEVSCNVSCLAGGISSTYLDNAVNVCQNGTFALETNGLEDLTLPCESDDGSSYQYGWRILADIYNNGDFAAVTEWEILGTNPTEIDVASFFIDDFGYIPPFVAGTPIPLELPYYYVPMALRIQGAAICINSDGTVVDICGAVTEGYNSSLIEINYLPEGGDCGAVGPKMGCTDMDACNYDETAEEDDMSCTYATDIEDCDGNCLVDVDCNGDCGGTAVTDCNGDCGGDAVEGTICTDADGMEGVYAADCTCMLAAVMGCTDMAACNYDETAEVDDMSCTYPESDNVDCDGNCIVELDCNEECGGTATVDCAGECGGAATAGTACTDDMGAAGTYDGDCNCVADAVLGCTDAEACNFNAEATEDDMSCTYPASENVDCDGNCLVDLDCNDECGGTATIDCAGECGGAATAGTACMDADGAAGTYDGDCNCVADPVPGCIDEMACNYDAAATVDDGSCTYPASDNVDCDGNCLVEVDCNDECGGTATVDCAGECGGGATAGTACMDANGAAGTYDGDCNCVAEAVLGCTDMDACNYDAAATEDDDSCTYPASDNVDCDGNCIVDTDCNGECGGTATTDCAGECGGAATAGTACMDDTGATGTYDGDCNCAVEAVQGCTDMAACNYDVAATEDDMSCTYPASDNVDCDGNCIVDTDCAGECGGAATAGTACMDANGSVSEYADDCSCPLATGGGPTCTDDTACNTGAQGGCTYPDAGYDCDGNCITDTDCAGECGGSAIEGTACTDANGNASMYADDCSCPLAVDDPDPTTCMSVGGTLAINSGGQYSSMGYICNGSMVVVEADNFLLLPGQVVNYVFHESGDVTSAAPITNILTYGSFFTNNSSTSKEVYVTAYGANVLADGTTDFTDPCITYSNTLMLTLLSPITIGIEESCDNQSSEFTFTITPTGGLPEAVPSTSYTISGDYFDGSIAAGGSQTVGPIADAENYAVTCADDNGCSTSISQSVNCTKLPIELISFKGEALDGGNILKWLTAAEINNEYFTIESSTNGTDFGKLTIIKGQGNTSVTSSYSYLDRTADKGMTYYRLSQTDFDGTTVDVETISVERGETSFSIMDVYPIPTSDFINMDFMAPEQSVVDIEIYDLVGNTIETHTITSEGSNLLKLKVGNYAVGVYFISIISDENKAIQKFVVE